MIYNSPDSYSKEREMTGLCLRGLASIVGQDAIVSDGQEEVSFVESPFVEFIPGGS